MKVQVARWGNSNAVRLPKSVVDELDLRPGAQLELTVEGGEMRLRRARRTPQERLQDMIAEARRLGPEYEPETVDWGPDRGSEIIDDDDPR